MLKKIAIIGAGGFAREVKWLISEINRSNPTYECIGYLVSDLTKLTHVDSKDEVLGDFTWIGKNNDSIDCFAMGIGTPGPKLKVSEILKNLHPDIEWPSLIHPSAIFDRSSCHVEEGVVIGAGVIGTVNITFEAFAMVNLLCTIGHESRIGRGSVLNPTVNISGGVTIGKGTLIGTGAQVLQYLTVGENATVGGGAVVTKNVEPGLTVVGMPAKPLEKKI